MRRADRLFQIIQILRGASQPVTAGDLAREMETTPRTIYRDIADLIGQRVPIRGEAGIGYVLEAGYDMPPLMLTPDEIEAAVLGAQWVADRGDPALARGARDLIAKIRDVVPERLRPMILQAVVSAPSIVPPEPDLLDLGRIRSAIRDRAKLRLRYSDRGGRTSERTVWPISVAYFQTVRLLVAWCELRNAFRHFRTDRIEDVAFLDERHPMSPEALRTAWQREERGVPLEDVPSARAAPEAERRL
ncbi:MAG: YafY family transcriptional regulator [Alphaproteobacteria bacterium]|nr:YafY family transcriptional regulator [Alphaproteobacteria bacterium]MCW5739859.1 YafY family transcriptional regulator [Alphaproteobacteria bacterium]